MFIILFYDIPKKTKKNNYTKIKKIAEKYLQRVQYSVFEGNLSEAVLFEMSMYYSEREILGIDKKEDIFF